ncbi:hypothetical protein [Nocardia sp. NPDC004722]
MDDERQLYIVQGYRVPGHDNQVEIPQMLLRWLRPGTYLGVRLHDSGRGAFTVTGTPVADTEALRQMNIPEHETAVEAPIAKSRWNW